MFKILFACGLILGGALMVANGITAEDPPAKQPASRPGKALRHVVMYQFKTDITPVQLREVIDAFAGLPKKIDAIRGFEMGTNVSPEGKSEGLTHIFVVTFADEAGRDAYLKHPAHDAYVAVVKDRREKVVVFDYWADK